jgi:hypothetical protein
VGFTPRPFANEEIETMKRVLVLAVVIGVLAASATSALAQDRPAKKRAGPPDANALTAERLQQLVERYRSATPEQQARMREMLRRAFAEPGAQPDARRRGRGPGERGPEARGPARRGEARGRHGPGTGRMQARGPAVTDQGTDRLRRMLRDMPAEKRQHLMLRLRNASPEDRAKFMRRLAAGPQGDAARRPGAPDVGQETRCPDCERRAQRKAQRHGRRGGRAGREAMWGNAIRGNAVRRNAMRRNAMMRGNAMRANAMRRNAMMRGAMPWDAMNRGGPGQMGRGMRDFRGGRDEMRVRGMRRMMNQRDRSFRRAARRGPPMDRPWMWQ